MPFPQRSLSSFAPFRSIVRRGKPRPFELILLLESPVFTGLAGFKPAPFLYPGRSRITPVSGSFLVKGAGYCRQEPPLATIACRQRHIYVLYYSCGRNRMHNVEAGNPGLWPGYLDLSNTPLSKKTLSSSKPPHPESSFAAFFTVLDRKPCPGLRYRGTLQGSVLSVPRGSGWFRRKRPVTGPRRPGSYPTGGSSFAASVPFRLYSLG